MNTVKIYSDKETSKDEVDSEKKKSVSNGNVDISNYEHSKKLSPFHLILISSIIIIVVIISIVLLVNKPWKKNKKQEDQPEIYQRELNYNDYKNELNCNLKVGDLRRLYITHTSNEDMLIDGIQIKRNVFTKKYIDVYIISENNHENKTIYNKTFKGSITIASKCISKENEECEVKDRVNLLDNAKTSNLRHLQITDLKDIPIPLCIFNITNNNIIISLSCPESLPENIKDEILSELKYFRPNFKLSANKKEQYNITNKNNINNLIRKSKGLCNLENDLNSFCDLDLHISKNNEGYLVSLDENNFINITTDEKNKFIKNKKTKLIDETSNLNNHNAEEYKKILDDFLSKLNPYIKYEENESIDNVAKLYNSKLLINKIKNSRELSESDKIYYKYFTNEESLFYKEILGAKINLKLKIDSGLNAETMKTILQLKLNEKEYELVHFPQFSNLNKIIEKLFSLSNAGNNLASQLYEFITNNLDNLTQEITIKLSNLNSLIVYKELTEIFDSSLSLKELKILPLDIVEESNYLSNLLKNKLKELDDENNELKNNSNILKNNINDYLEGKLFIMNNTFNELYDLQTLLKSPKNIYSEINIYYLNNTPTSYVDTIEKIKNLYISFNEIKEKEIKNEIELSLNEFENNFEESIKKPKKSFDNLYSKLENNSFTIEKKKNRINLEYNDINYELADGVREKYDMNLNESIDIGNILDNDKIFDKVFDKTMSSFLENMTSILKYMGNKKDQIITLIDEVLQENLFSTNEKRKIKDNITNCGFKIINNIKNENNYYMNLIKENISGFLQENLEEINSLILNLNILLSEESLKEISASFEYEFNSSLNAIINDIENEKQLIIKYYSAYNTSLESVLLKIEDSSEFRVLSYTKKINQTYFAKHDIFKGNLQRMRNYINNQLYNDFLDEYKNIISKLKEILLSIKNNKISEIYPGIREFDFYVNHLNNLDELNKKIDKYFSLELFNKVYLSKLNNFRVNYSEVRIDAIDEFIDIHHNVISKFGILTSDANNKNDYYFCIEMVCEGRYHEYKYCTKYYYDDYIKEGNYSIYAKGNLESREQFEYLASLLDTNATSYNTKMYMIKDSLLSLEDDIVNQNLTEGYLLPIENEINSILSKKYEEEILKYSYNYYNNNINSKIENILNDINNKWNENFDLLEIEIKNNLAKFKYSIEEFGAIAKIFKDLYLKDIYNEYINSIINLQKNEYNFTISYYYNYLLSLVNSTYLYIINNIPSNELMLNTIINLRKNELKEKFNKIIKRINESKNIALNYNNQKQILNFEESDFFNISSFLSKYNEEASISLAEKTNQISEIRNNKQNNEYSITSKLYLENSEFGKQIISFFEGIYEKVFIYLNQEKFKETVNNNWIFDQDDIINRINLTMFNYNREIYKEFLSIKDNFTLSLEREINVFYSKESIIKNINKLYNEGLNNFNSTQMNNFKNNLYPILDEIYEYFESESERISTTAVSYTSDFTQINTTVKKYKENIFNQIKSIYTNIIDDFREKMINNVYKEYIEKNLNDYLEESKTVIKNFKEYNLLNSSYNLREIIDNIIETIVDEYKKIVKKQIDYKYQMKLKNTFDLDELEEFLNFEIEYEYNSILFPVLKEIAIYTPGEAGYTGYDFNNQIKDNINSLIITNMNEIKKIFSLIKGNNYEVSLAPKVNDWPITDFSKIYSTLLEIENNFEIFVTNENSYEKNYLKENIKSIIKSNFNNSLVNIISSFGNDFFERTFKYNEYFKLEDLYNNLKYSLIQTFKYYQSKYDEFNTSNVEYPKELKQRITNLNNIESLIIKNTNYINESLYTKVSDFINELKDNLINRYISFMENDAMISMSFNQNIIQMINNNLKSIKNEIVDEYVNILNYYLKEKFINLYTNKINEESEKLIDLVNDYRNQLIQEIDDSFTLETENVLEEINNKIINILEQINQYHSNHFKISEEFIQYINNYGENNIKPIYNEFKSKIDEITKNQIINNFEKNSKNYENSFNLDTFLNISNETASNLKETYFDKIELFINDYKSNYPKKFEEELYKENNTINEYPSEETFKKIFKNYDDTKIFIQTLKEFNDYEKIITKNINNLNLAFKESKKFIEDYNDDEENQNNFNNKLLYLKEMSLNYYNRINDSYYSIKQYLNESIEKINEEINKCINITYETLIKEYKKLSEKENLINEEYQKNEEEINTIDTYYQIEDDYYFIEAKIKNLEHHSIFTIDVIYENNDYKYPQIFVNITNKSRPKNIIFDIYTHTGYCAKNGIILDANLNDVSYIMNLNINTKSRMINATTITNFEKFDYTSENYEYEDSDEEICFVVAGINFCIPPHNCPNKNTISKEKFSNDEKDFSITNYIKY